MHDGALCNLAHLLLTRRNARQATSQHPQGPSTLHLQGTTAHHQGSTENSQGSTLRPHGTAEHSQGTSEHLQGSTEHLQSSTEHSQGIAEQSAEAELKRVLRAALRANPEREDIAQAARDLGVSIDSDPEVLVAIDSDPEAQGGTLQG